jgi:hypothetical protein
LLVQWLAPRQLAVFRPGIRGGAGDFNALWRRAVVLGDLYSTEAIFGNRTQDIADLRLDLAL